MGSGAGAQNPQLNIVSFSETFNLYYTSRYSAKTLDKIDDFIEHFEKYNLFGDPLKGYPALMNPLMILVKIIKLRWIHILSYDQMVSRKINNQTTRCANSIFYTTLFTNSAPNYT